jgi:hypothetical protein
VAALSSLLPPERVAAIPGFIKGLRIMIGEASRNLRGVLAANGTEDLGWGYNSQAAQVWPHDRSRDARAIDGQRRSASGRRMRLPGV